MWFAETCPLLWVQLSFLAASHISASRTLASMSSGKRLPSTDSFDLEIVEYQVLSGDATYYNNHIFTIKVWIHQHMYVVHRSYAAFCELDGRLRKQYARSHLPTLKLAGALAAIKIAKRNSTPKDGNSALTYPPESENDNGQPKLFRRVDNAEAIGQKGKYLTAYLHALLKIPEVVLSEAMLYFLDEESKDGEAVVDSADDTLDSREVNVLLNGEPMTTWLVRVDKKYDLSVPANVVVIWAFNTVKYDIGFSILHNKREVCKYQRYDSHQKIIKGHFEMQTGGDVSFVWDNSYSKWRSKTLNFVIRVVTTAEFALAQTIAAQGMKDKAQFLAQRTMIKAALTGLSSRILQAKGNIIASTALPHTPSLGSLTNLGVGSGIAMDTAQSADGSFDGGNQYTHSNDGYATLEGDPSTPTAHESAAARSNHHSQSQRTHSNAIDTAAPGSVPEFADLAQALRELNKLRNEKKTLQQALGESETALVTERNIAAQYTQQYEELSQRYGEQENELTSLKVEFEQFRESYYNEMESKMAETLAAFSVTSAGAAAGGGSAPNAGNADEGGADNDREVITPLGSPLRGSLRVNHSFRSDTAGSGNGSEGTGAMTAADHNATEGTTPLSEYSEDQSAEIVLTGTAAAEVSFNQLLSVSATELSNLSTDAMIEYYQRLQEHTQLMVKRGYLTKEIETLLAKLKNEKKQLKAYAIQTKQSLDKLTAQYIHIEQDKAQLLTQVRELRDLVALLETDRKGLREHISLLLGNDTAAPGRNAEGPTQPSGPDDSTVVGSGSAKEDPRSADLLSRSHSNGSADSHDRSLSDRIIRSTAREETPTSTSTNARKARSGSEGTLRSFFRTGLAAVTSFDLSEIIDAAAGIDNTAQTQTARSPPRPAALATQHSDDAVNHQVLHSASDDSLPTAPIGSTKLVISAEDLQQATAEAPRTNTLRDGEGGEETHHEGTDDESRTSDRSISGCGVATVEGNNATAVENSTDAVSGMGNTRTRSGSTEEEGGSHFSKVTEQLYGILPTWGQLNALRSKSLV
jgi:predicted  nucleic acid-binding Zn-ribbon protein